MAECTSKLNAIDDALYVIGGKWKLRVIASLREGHKRFNEIQRVSVGISARVLSNELKELEMNGLVTRTVLDTRPIPIEYALTPYSKSLSDLIMTMRKWGIQHRKKIMSE